MRVPLLGPRGEGWVAIQVVLLAIVAVLVASAVLAGPHRDVVFALPVVAAGALLFAWSAWALGGALTPFPRPKRGVRPTRRGPYAYARHPMYAAVILICAGLSMLAPLAWIPTAALAVVLGMKARLEDAFLGR